MRLVALEIEIMQTALVLRAAAHATHALELPRAAALGAPQALGASLPRRRAAHLRHRSFAAAHGAAHAMRLVGTRLPTRPLDGRRRTL